MQRYVLKLIQELCVAIYISCISNCIYITLITCIIIIICYAQIHSVYMIDNIFFLYMNWYLKLNGLNRPLANVMLYWSHYRFGIGYISLGS